MTDYAVVILADMDEHKNVPCAQALASATTIANNTGLPEPTVSKVLKLLARQGIINSSRGAAGGYSLNKTPDQINMAHVITATDGPIALTACVDESTECCDRADSCSIKGQWNPLNRAMINALESVSLSEMISPSVKGAAR